MRDCIKWYETQHDIKYNIFIATLGFNSTVGCSVCSKSGGSRASNVPDKQWQHNFTNITRNIQAHT